MSQLIRAYRSLVIYLSDEDIAQLRGDGTLTASNGADDHIALIFRRPELSSAGAGTAGSLSGGTLGQEAAAALNAAMANKLRDT
jgi:hypothetical protein